MAMSSEVFSVLRPFGRTSSGTMLWGMGNWICFIGFEGHWADFCAV